ncbi:MAG: hypothetical protein NT008_10150 [Methylococcales bacterium]|nr:hypothetical protein [Methylococcales bacterium]
MTFKDLIPTSLFLFGVVVGAVLDDRMAAQDDQKQLMCQITDKNSGVHLMPCVLTDSYLASVEL